MIRFLVDMMFLEEPHMSITTCTQREDIEHSLTQSDSHTERVTLHQKDRGTLTAGMSILFSSK